MDGSTLPPDGFGSVEVRWIPSTAHDPIEVAWLYLQHRVLTAVKAAWPSAYPSDAFTGKTLGSKVGEGERPWQKRLKGTQPLSLTDLVTLASLFGADILSVLPRAVDDLFPAEYAPMLRQWRPGAGVRPAFVDSEPDAVAWQTLTVALARFDADERLAGRSHLISADTYRYFFASAYGGMGGQIGGLELVSTGIERCEAMVMHGVRRVAILVADLRDPIPHLGAAEAIIRVLHEASIFDAHDRVVLIVAGRSAASQIRVLLPMAFAESGEPFKFELERTESMYGAVADEVMSLENNRLKVVGRSPLEMDGQILALQVDK